MICARQTKIQSIQPIRHTIALTYHLLLLRWLWLLLIFNYKMNPIDGCDLAKKREVNTSITIIIITAANDVGNNPL